MSLTRSAEERAQLRNARAEAAQAQAVTQAVEKSVGMVRELSQSTLTGPDGRQGSALDALARLLRRAWPGSAAHDATKDAPAQQARPEPPDFRKNALAAPPAPGAGLAEQMENDCSDPAPPAPGAGHELQPKRSC